MTDTMTGSLTGTPGPAPASTRVRFGRRQQRGLLLGLSPARVACVAVAAITITAAVFLAGVLGVALVAPLWIGVLALAFFRHCDRPLVEVLPTLGHYLARRIARQDRFRASPDHPRPGGTMALPGEAAALRFLADPTSQAALVHDPHGATVTVIAHVEHTAYVLLSPDEQARRVSGWSRALAGLAASGRCRRLQVLDLAAPDTGEGIVGWWRGHRASSDTPFASEQYEELMCTRAPAAATHQTLVAVALQVPNRLLWAKGTGSARGLELVRQEMSAFEAGLRAADLRLVEWLRPHALADVIRGAYDPLRPTGTTVGSLRAAGPVAIDEHWDRLDHDSGCSAVLWISEWPRIDVPADFLHALVFQPGVRKTLSITATPLSSRQAMRDIRRAKVEHVTDAAQKARIGAIADLADAAELDDVLDRERALINGHADMRFTGLIVVTARDDNELDAAVTQIERAAVQSGCETRRLLGQQARAFTAAALPLARRVD